MKVLLTGVNTYIGNHLIPVLLEKGHEVVCLVRDKNLFLKQNKFEGNISTINGDLLRKQSIEPFPEDIDVAYYLINSLSQTSGFAGLEALAAQNFVDALDQTNCQQIITLGEIGNYLTSRAISRLNVEDILYSADAALSILNTTMVIGYGSIAMEMFKALTEKNPIVLARSWIKALVQPISTSDVLAYLVGCLLNEATYHLEFEIGGPEVLPFKQMLLMYIATFKQAKPNVVTVPLLTPKLSSYLLNFLSTINYATAQSLIENLSNDTVCQTDAIQDILPRQCLTFKQALRLNTIAAIN